MSKYKTQPFDFSQIRTYPLKSRRSKVSVKDFARPAPEGAFPGLLDAFPDILAGSDLKAAVEALRSAREKKRAILWGLGGHVVKVGLAPILIHLMRRDYATGFALNGSGIIHDFEIALVGSTSEDVEAELPSGNFGMAEETGTLLNQAINEGAREDLGIGEAVGRALDRTSPPFAGLSLLAQTYKETVPVTVHIALGTDIIHYSPHASGEALGKAGHRDFRLFTALVEGLNEGGVYLNVGSAVILPEVFLKAVTVLRSSGRRLEHFTTVNMDFLRLYRPEQNVVKRPTQGTGRGIHLTGHHEIMLPLLAAALPA
ncbi:MAG: hypothetical protein HY652_13000 [Acidobacteria bacterium]|nr:hypothetical protein [Acidobacteriota bacterium]